MEIKQAHYIKSAETLDQCPPHNLREICFIGRSNVGKSSLINALTGHPRLAKTSSTPGKTRLFNFFSINEDQWCLVDLPGYGYAKVSQEQRRDWNQKLFQFLLQREQLALIVLLMDARHDPMDPDLEMAYWLAEHERRFIVALTKADKLSKNAQQRSLQNFRKELADMNIETDVILTSATKGSGLIDLTSWIADVVASPT
jgi:GTP-binding protein